MKIIIIFVVGFVVCGLPNDELVVGDVSFVIDVVAVRLAEFAIESVLGSGYGYFEFTIRTRAVDLNLEVVVSVIVGGTNIYDLYADAEYITVVV